jgi:hypothetical protein
LTCSCHCPPVPAFSASAGNPDAKARAGVLVNLRPLFEAASGRVNLEMPSDQMEAAGVTFPVVRYGRNPADRCVGDRPDRHLRPGPRFCTAVVQL